MTTLQKHPMELVRDDILTAYPLTGEHGTWTVTDPPVQYGDRAEIEYRDATGVRGRFPVSVHTKLTVTPSRRQELISGLRAMAQFLEDHPDVPVGRRTGAHIRYFPQNEDFTDPHAEVDRIADLIGEETRSGKHYVTAKAFGPVEYEAIVTVQRVRKARKSAKAESAVHA